MIERILPPFVAVAEAFEPDCADMLPPQRPTVTVNSAEGTENSAASWQATRDVAHPCARVASQRLTWPTGPVLWAARGAPRWPEGMTGSFTYCTGYRATAVALTRNVAALAVDAQRNEPLPDDGLLDLVAYDEERQRLADLTARVPGICWDRLLFSAKLAVYKAWFPSAAWWLNLELADVAINEYGNTFTAHLLVPGPVADGKPLTQMCGRWLAHDGFLVTGICVHRTTA